MENRRKLVINELFKAQKILKQLSSNVDPIDFGYIYIAGGKEFGVVGSVDGTLHQAGELFLNMLSNTPELLPQMVKAIIGHIDNNGCGDPDCKGCNPVANSKEFESFLNNLINKDHD